MLQDGPGLVRCPIVHNLAQKVHVGGQWLRGEEVVGGEGDSREDLGGQRRESSAAAQDGIWEVLHCEAQRWVVCGNQGADLPCGATDLFRRLADTIIM